MKLLSVNCGRSGGSCHGGGSEGEGQEKGPTLGHNTLVASITMIPIRRGKCSFCLQARAL
jgi:hypothetical protein